MADPLKIYIQDSVFAHCIFSNNPLPPKQFTDKVEWLRDATYQLNDIVVWTDDDIPKSLHRPGPNIAWLYEAWDHIPHLYKFILRYHSHFDTIWTHDKIILDACPNAKRLLLGGCWIDEFDWGIHPKSKNFSIIASAKRQHPGHVQRHQVIAGAGGNIDVFGGGYNPLKDKIDGLRDYRYHFCIENIRRDYWFTEKLIDCFVTGTLPIYWGCPSIGDFFNTDGMLCYEDVRELPALLKKCTPEYYDSKLDALKENFELAREYRLVEERIPDIL